MYKHVHPSVYSSVHYIVIAGDLLELYDPQQAEHWSRESLFLMLNLDSECDI